MPFVPDGPDLVRHRREHGSARDARQGRPEHRRDPRLDHGRQGRPPRNLRDAQERRPRNPGIGGSRRRGETETRHGGRGRSRRAVPLPRLRDAGRGGRDRVSELRGGVLRRRIDGIRMPRVQDLGPGGRGPVTEVKPLLVSAKRIGLEIEEGKRIINDAIQAGKGRDIERAVTLIADARRTLDVAFVDFIGGQIDTFLQELRTAKGDAGVQAATPKLQEAVGRLEAGDYDAAWDRFQLALGTFQTDARDFHEARQMIDGGDRLAREARAMGMDLRGPERTLRQGRESLDPPDVTAAPASRAGGGPWGWPSATRSEVSAKAANRSTGGMSRAPSGSGSRRKSA